MFSFLPQRESLPCFYYGSVYNFTLWFSNVCSSRLVLCPHIDNPLRSRQILHCATICMLQLVRYLTFVTFLLRHGPNMIHVPNDVSRQPWPEALRAFVEQISSENSIEQHRALEIHTEAAISELRNVPEIQLLELVAATLGANSTRLQILQSFYALCSNLLEASDVPIPSELRAALDMGEESADQQKRCTQPTENDCRGMCGAKCDCWESVCGDCCYHRGCYEHDLCCKHAGYFSFYCLSVIGTFSCDKGFAFYPKCLEGSGWSLPW